MGFTVTVGIDDPALDGVTPAAGDSLDVQGYGFVVEADGRLLSGRKRTVTLDPTGSASFEVFTGEAFLTIRWGAPGWDRGRNTWCRFFSVLGLTQDMTLGDLLQHEVDALPGETPATPWMESLLAGMQQAANNAEQAEADAAAAAGAAADSETAAASSAQSAHDSAVDAADSATAAASSAQAAAGSATTAGEHETAAAASAAAAHLSEVAAATSATTAGEHETAAADSATAAHLSEVAAATSATTAGESATAAAQSAQDAHDAVAEVVDAIIRVDVDPGDDRVAVLTVPVGALDPDDSEILYLTVGA